MHGIERTFYFYIAGAVGVVVGVTYFKFIERIPIVISLPFDIS